jgi:hypothetical protein
MEFENIKDVCYLSTINFHDKFSCKDCQEKEHDLGSLITHYLNKHGYILLHVGTETAHNSQGGFWHSTVAVIGKNGLRAT